MICLRVTVQFKVLLLACILVNTGCSNTSSYESTGIPEIQGVWRYSDSTLPTMGASLTYEFQEDQFRVIGHPDIHAYGNYQFEKAERGGYQIALAPAESQGFAAKTIQVQPTGGRILIIDQRSYRRILRH
ncbi:MAG: hypothetical protein E6Q83_16345 [Thiothrix sp.]|nr:MAG: hypothetical protein E6Q83_16345 [Thiothrix sp.]